MSLAPAVRRKARSPWLLAGALLLSVVFCCRLSGPASAGEWRLADFVQYWSAGRLTLLGDNPYDPVAMQRLERQAGRDDNPLLMFNPPWTLAVVMPFGLIEHRVAYVAWLTLLVSVLAGSTVLLWHYYGGPRAHTGASLLIAFTFVPTFLALFLAQISPLLLLGAVLFLVAERRGRLLLAGAAADLMLIKPHLTYLFWLAFLLWSLERRRWRALGGATLTGIAASIVPLLWNHRVWAQYVDFILHDPPAQYSSPTLGTLLRMLFGQNDFRLQYLALLPGLAWFAVFYWRRRSTWDWGRAMPWLLLMSLFTAAYGAWPFDLVLLLVPVLQMAATAGRRARPLFAFHGVFNGVAATMVAFLIHFFWFMWMTPVLAVGYFLATKAHAAVSSNCTPKLGAALAPAGAAHAQVVAIS